MATQRILFIDADRHLRELFTSYTAEPAQREAFADHCDRIGFFPHTGYLSEVSFAWCFFSSGYNLGKKS